jgi:hypothetical protein
MAEDVIESLKAELAKKLNETHALKQAISVLEGSSVLVSDAPTQRKPYEGLGIADAAIRFIQEMGSPQGTRAIADALLSRGLTTKSNNYTATVYSTLDNSRRLIRTPQGLWDIKPVLDSRDE